ncbi:hypothetical protein KEJ34_02770 [Candidatus Bathyarchaeota archaeon]|nr:hypothetical protein [Candidatus Bathyarchaeota archaeon]
MKRVRGRPTMLHCLSRRPPDAVEPSDKGGLCKKVIRQMHGRKMPLNDQIKSILV